MPYISDILIELSQGSHSLSGAEPMQDRLIKTRRSKLLKPWKIPQKFLKKLLKNSWQMIIKCDILEKLCWGKPFNGFKSEDIQVNVS